MPVTLDFTPRKLAQDEFGEIAYDKKISEILEKSTQPECGGDGAIGAQSSCQSFSCQKSLP
jgi:hypothetical protein